MVIRARKNISDLKDLVVLSGLQCPQGVDLDGGYSLFDVSMFAKARSMWVRGIDLWLPINGFCWTLGPCLREVRRIYEIPWGQLRLNGRYCSRSCDVFFLMLEIIAAALDAAALLLSIATTP